MSGALMPNARPEACNAGRPFLLIAVETQVV
jgi:hypothetical protein